MKWQHCPDSILGTELCSNLYGGCNKVTNIYVSEVFKKEDKRKYGLADLKYSFTAGVYFIINNTPLVYMELYRVTWPNCLVATYFFL